MEFEIKLKKLKELIIQTEKIKMNPVVTDADLLSAEQEQGVTLPEEYTAFITTIGNGGKLPDHTDSIGNLLPIEQCDLKLVAKPFTHVKTLMWVDIGYDASEDPKGKVEKACNGHFTIMECADGFTWELIVTGKCRGEMWLFGADGMMRGKKLYFLEWVERYIKDELLERMRGVVTESFDDYVARVQKKIKRRKMLMNPPIPLPEIREMEERYKIQLPVDYVAFITTIGDGCKRMPTNNLNHPWGELRSINDCDFEKAARPFPLTERWHYGWSIGTKTVQYDIEKDPDGKWAALQYGRFCFIKGDEKSLACSYSLIISGPAQGQIWGIDNKCAARLGTTTFTSWFEFYLDGND